MTEDRIREALDVLAQYRAASAADWSEFQCRLRRSSSARIAFRRRWFTVAIAAAVVILVGVPLILAPSWTKDHPTAGHVSVVAGRATVAGVGFPVPQGWSATAIDRTDTAVTVCIAAQPSARCHGVTIEIALPAVARRATTVDSVPPKNSSCGAKNPLVWRGPPMEVGDRQAHGWFWKCPPNDSVTVGWLVDDGSLAAWTSVNFRPQATMILRGMDFSHSVWSAQGPLSEHPGVSQTSTETSEAPVPSIADSGQTR